MTDEVKASTTYDQNTSAATSATPTAPATPGPIIEHEAAASLPPQERNQPDPSLRLSVGRVGAGGIALVAVVCAIIVGVVLWGLNSPAPNAQDVNSAASTSTNPPGPGTSGAGTPNPLPSNNAKSGGKG
jgi:hypothetical protein